MTARHRLHPCSQTLTEVPMFSAHGRLRLWRTGAPPCLYLDGEVDARSLSALTGALADLLDQDATELHLDLAAVVFMDSSGIGRILLTAQSLHERGGRLICHAVPAHLARVLDITGWADTPGLHLHGDCLHGDRLPRHPAPPTTEPTA